jgi:hypothetical protein
VPQLFKGNLAAILLNSKVYLLMVNSLDWPEKHKRNSEFENNQKYTLFDQ